MTMSKQYTLNIFDVLKEIDRGNMSYYDSLPDEKKKGFVPVVTHQWLLGHPSKDRLQLLDCLVNTQLFTHYSMPNLMYKLMVSASDGKIKKYKYTKIKRKKVTPSIRLELISKYYRCGLREANEYNALMTVDDVIEIAEELGEDKATIRKLKK